MAKTYYSSMIILIVKSTNLLGTSPNLKYLYRGKHFNHSQLNINIEKHQMYIYRTFSNHCPLDRVLKLFSPNHTNSTKSCFNLPSLLQYMIHSFSLSYHHFVHRVLLYILMLNSYHIYCFSSFLPILICIFSPFLFFFLFCLSCVLLVVTLQMLKSGQFRAHAMQVITIFLSQFPT